MKAIINAQLVLEGGKLTKGTILLDKGIIVAIGDAVPPADAEIIDACGLYVGPGYVDIHCHAGGCYKSFEAPVEMAAFHMQHGTTSLCPSLGYNLNEEQVVQGIERIIDAMENHNTSIEGIHFEGPYTNPKYGSDSRTAWALEREQYERVFEKAKGYVSQVTYAPEREGIVEFENYLSQNGYTMALGHTEMSPADLERAMKAGATIVTHLFDAMGCWRGNDSIKQTGVIQETAAEVALAAEGLYYELICDSRAVHVKPANLKLTYRLAGPENIILITDCTAYPHDSTQYPEDDPRSAPDLNYNANMELAGSRLTMEMAAQNMQKYTGASVADIFRMASENPAKAVKIFDHAGSLQAGKKANIIICDDKMNIKDIYFEGCRVER